MIILACRLRISSRLSLEEVGQILSDRVFGGIPFVGREEYIRDEIPAIYSESWLFGTRFVLTGEPDDEGYYLQADTDRKVIAGMTPKQIGKSCVEIAPLIAKLLKGVDGLIAYIEDSGHC